MVGKVIEVEMPEKSGRMRRSSWSPPSLLIGSEREHGLGSDVRIGGN